MGALIGTAQRKAPKHRMSFFANYRADRLIAEVKSSGNPGSPWRKRPWRNWLRSGPSAIEPIVAALTTAEKRETWPTWKRCRADRRKDAAASAQTMTEVNGRAMSGIAWALSSSRNYPPSALLDALNKEGHAEAGDSRCDRGAEDSLHSARFAERRVFPGCRERSGLFKIIGEIADESSVDDLDRENRGQGPGLARLHIIQVLGRFNLPKVKEAVQKQLKDNSKLIRSAALSTLARMDGPFDMALICGMLRDPEIDVQNKAVDVVVMPIIPKRSSTWSMCSRTRTSTPAAPRSRS
jgi:hypothetical protein